MTPREQLFLELLNRARLDPAAEVARNPNVSSVNQGLAPGTLSLQTLQPLAFSPELAVPAAEHSQWMLDNNVFSHTGAGGSTIRDRIEASDYVLTPPWIVGENLSWIGTTGGLNHNQASVSHHNNLFASPGHRVNILQPDFAQVGIAQIQGSFTWEGVTYTNSSMMTNKFGGSAAYPDFLTGVAYVDNDGDDFYSIGEGVGNVTFSVVGGGTGATASAGGYAVGLPASHGMVQIEYVWGPNAHNLWVEHTGGNIKLDVVNETTVMSSATFVMGDGIENGKLLGTDSINMTGNDLDNRLYVGRGDNVIDGAEGSDTAVFAGSINDFTVEAIEGGFVFRDLRTNHLSLGENTLFNIQAFEFEEGTITLDDLREAGLDPDRVTPHDEDGPPPGEDPEEEEDGDSSGGGCFIATAAYSDHDHPEVMALRRFRDEVLMTSLAGRSAVRLYYRLSPPLARWMRKHPRVCAFARSVLSPLSRRLDPSS